MKIKLVFCLMWNFFRINILKIFSGNKFKSGQVQLVSPATEIELGKNSRIIFNGRIHSEKNVLVSVKDGGELICGNLYINRNSMIVCRKSISIGNGTTIGPNVVIYDHDHDVEEIGKLKKEAVVIGENVWIGAGAIILKGVTIGDNSVIAAGTVVSKDVPENSLVRSQLSTVYKEL